MSASRGKYFGRSSCSRPSQVFGEVEAAVDGDLDHVRDGARGPVADGPEVVAPRALPQHARELVEVVVQRLLRARPVLEVAEQRVEDADRLLRQVVVAVETVIRGLVELRLGRACGAPGDQPLDAALRPPFDPAVFGGLEEARERALAGPEQVDARARDRLDRLATGDGERRLTLERDLRDHPEQSEVRVQGLEGRVAAAGERVDLPGAVDHAEGVDVVEGRVAQRAAARARRGEPAGGLVRDAAGAAAASRSFSNRFARRLFSSVEVCRRVRRCRRPD